MENGVRHGHTLGVRGSTARSPTYNSWRSMVSRCTCASDTAFENYGARGIVVCDKWRDFKAFLADMGARPKGMTLDRIDNAGDYEPANCRWATLSDQCRNRRSSRWITAQGRTLTLVAWADRLGISKKTMSSRLARHGEEGMVARWMT